MSVSSAEEDNIDSEFRVLIDGSEVDPSTVEHRSEIIGQGCGFQDMGFIIYFLPEVTLIITGESPPCTSTKEYVNKYYSDKMKDKGLVICTYTLDQPPVDIDHDLELVESTEEVTIVIDSENMSTDIHINSSLTKACR